MCSLGTATGSHTWQCTRSGRVQRPPCTGGASVWGSASFGSACLAASVVSDSLRPHGPWLARLLCPCNSPGKNTGVGCYFPLCLLALGNFNNKHLLQSGKSGGCCFLVTKHVQLFCHPMDCSPPGSSVHEISQEILERVAMSSSRGSSWARDGTQVYCTGRWILYHWATREPSGGQWIPTGEKRCWRTAGVPPPPHNHTCFSVGTSRPLHPLPGAGGPRGLCVPGGIWWHRRVLRRVAQQEKPALGAGCLTPMLAPPAQPWNLGCHPPTHKVIIRIWSRKTNEIQRKEEKALTQFRTHSGSIPQWQNHVKR